jgi:hypothetical protein
VIRFPRGGRHNELEWHEPADDAARSAPVTSEASLISLLDAKRRHDGDDDGDGGGRAA